MMIVNDDYRVVNKLEASLTDDARVNIYDRQMFIIQATDFTKSTFSSFWVSTQHKQFINWYILNRMSMETILLVLSLPRKPR